MASAATLNGKLFEGESALGRPDCELPGVHLYLGDCLELMRRLPDGVFSLTVTSPPYNIGKEYESPMPISDYLHWCERWIAEIYRLTSPTGAFWLNLGYLKVAGKGKAIPIPYLLWDKVPFYIIQEIVWNYGAGVACRKSFSPRNEKFLWCVKNPDEYVFNLDAVRDPNVKYPKQRKNGKLKCNPLGKNPTDVWKFPKVTSGANRASEERTPHPAQFPVAVIERIVKACTKEGDVVLDPFMGSGSTAEACLGNGRKCVGLEVAPEYMEIARRRLAAWIRAEEARKAQLQLPLREQLE